jgi:hypothetical protein
MIICSLAFGEKYVWRLGRLKEMLATTNPGVPFMHWIDTMPPGAQSFNDSMYGFKPHCIQACLDAGHKQIVFIDCTCVVHGDLSYYQQFVEEYGVLAVQDDNKLTGFCSNKVLKYIGQKREFLHDKHLVGGSFYYFDFNNDLCRRIFDWWMTTERLGLYGSQREQASEGLQGHRSDETMMALALYLNGSKPYTKDTRYNWAEGGLINKAHFK